MASSCRSVYAHDTGEIADTHVVGDDGEVVPAEDLLRFGQVTHGAGERLLWIGVHPRVDARSEVDGLCLVAATTASFSR